MVSTSAARRRLLLAGAAIAATPVFARIGVLDGPANVAPFWDTSFNAVVASA
ncbi:hypothetical protein [Burkholderia sp. Bp8998]|uniref:hypothetical protein n=1 Tax=Burkholderia sp. Bp8998 TaxID=2184557 RepID=UPI00163A7611|nr:hypothetical protein [Burkholderia sp. Bp8998]